MATATYVQKGYQIDYTPAEGVAWGQVIPFADCIGVAAETIIAGETGAVTIVGVYEMQAASGVEIKTGRTYNVSTPTASSTHRLQAVPRQASA